MIVDLVVVVGRVGNYSTSRRAAAVAPVCSFLGSAVMRCVVLLRLVMVVTFFV